MPGDLFKAALAEQIALPGARLSFWPGVDWGREPQALLVELIESTPWREQDITLFGKTYRQPRLLAWYGDPGASYAYSGTRYQPLAWTATLQDLRERVEQLTGERFNSVLLNYYRDGRDSMGLHADDEPELGEQPAIASLSLGAPRRFVMKSRRRDGPPGLRLDLLDGSLLLMAGTTQANWKHGINKTIGYD